MPNRKRQSRLEAQALRQLQSMLRDQGQKFRSARQRRRWTQAELGRRADLSQQTISRVERGDGGTLAVVTWQRIALVLSIPLQLKLGRDALELPEDAGHLEIQEFMLLLGRENGYGRTFELQTKSTNASRSTDVGLVSHAKRRLIRIECVNTFGNIGDAVRSSDRKDREAEGLAIVLGQGTPYAVHTCWVIRSTRRNRALLARYPEIFASRFTGSSRGWVAALAYGADPPVEAGLVWCDLAATRLIAWRRARYQRSAHPIS